VKEVQYNGLKIPKGITMIMNAQQANLSEEWFGKDSLEFRPDRFIDNESSLPTLAFGAGSRQCPATNIGSRIMYSILTRMILAFELGNAPPGARPASLDYRDFSDLYGLVTIPRSYDCSVVARKPEWLQSLHHAQPNGA
jgi:phenylacetate 2-hydroxylase